VGVLVSIAWAVMNGTRAGDEIATFP